MSPKYIHAEKDWPRFTWDKGLLSKKVEKVRFVQGKLLGNVFKFRVK